MKTLLITAIAISVAAISARSQQVNYSGTIGAQNNITQLNVNMGGGTDEFFTGDYLVIHLYNLNQGPFLTPSIIDNLSPHLSWSHFQNSSTYQDFQSSPLTGNVVGGVTATLRWTSSVSIDGNWVEVHTSGGNGADASAPSGSITDSSGNVFSFGSSAPSGWHILKNGVDTTGQGWVLLYNGGNMYTSSYSFNWYQYNGTNWTQVSAPNFCGSLYASPTNGFVTSGCQGFFSIGSANGSSGYHLLLNNVDTGGNGYFLAAGADGNTYTFASDKFWYLYSGGTWVKQTTPPALAGVFHSKEHVYVGR